MKKKSDLAIAYSTQKHNKKKKMAEGGAASPTKTATSTSSPTKTDTSTSTTGNKTKTGGSNPGGASTGGAGTVTITTGKNPPKAINISHVGGKTDAKNHGGMDPGDEDDKMKMALGGAVEGPGAPGRPYSRNPGTPAKKPDDTRVPDSEFMIDEWSKGNPPARKPDDQRRPKSAYLETNDWSDGMKPSRAPFAEGGEVTSKPNAPRPGQASTESQDLNARAARQGLTLAQMAERHESEAAKFRMYADGGIIEPSGTAQETQYPGTKPRVPNDHRRPKDAYIDTENWSDMETPSRKPFAHGGMVDEDDRPGSVAEDIMRKRTRDRSTEMHNSDKGEADMEKNSEEAPNAYYGHNRDTANRPQYDDTQISKQPEDSNQHDDPREEARSDKNNMVDQIIKKLRSLRR